MSLGCPLVTVSTPSSVTAPVKGSKSRSVPYTSCPCIPSVRQAVSLLEASTVGLALLHTSGRLHSLLHLLFWRQGLLVNSELVNCDSLSGQPPPGIIVSPLYNKLLCAQLLNLDSGEDRNSGLFACTLSILLTEPSPRPL